ncbi:MAG: hypothetical protein ABSD48_05655 [Armatimonadota bacterium]|jgi:hypothetical protein
MKAVGSHLPMKPAVRPGPHVDAALPPAIRICLRNAPALIEEI